MEEITKPQLNKNNRNTPYNIDYEDFYYSKADGLAEAHYVFQQCNSLAFSWKNKQIFTIAETGFGTGLNFLATWQTWKNSPQRCEHLHYIAIEKHPLSAQELTQLLAPWPELAPYTAELIQSYPPPLTGIHRLNLANGSVTLTLCFMDIAAALNELVMTADCWFLDGFAPAKNPAMWSQEVMLQMAQLSKPGSTTLSTYTAAAQVRRNLQAAGWIVKKRPGFGKKREMLTATLPETFEHSTHYQPWYAPALTTTPPVINNNTERTATIIGAGIAGCQLAYALAQRNWRVNLIERHSTPAQEASGNPAGIISPKMTAKPGWGERFYRQAFLYTLQQLRQLKAAGHDIEWDDCGSLQLNHNEREQQRWQALQTRGFPADFIQLPDAEQAAALAGIDLAMGGSFFPQAGWVKPRSYCAALIQHPNITVTTETEALSFDCQGGQYHIHTTSGQAIPNSDILLISNGRDVHSLLPQNYLPLTAVRGQTSTAQASTESQYLKVAIGHEGYLTPAIDGLHVFGATFERDVTEPIVTTNADQLNQQQLQQHLPKFNEALHNINSGHAAIRISTPDRYPYCGALPNEEFYRSAYADLHHGRKYQSYPPAHYHPGLFIATGFGSRGLTTSALSAELIASLINGEPLPLEKSLYYQLHPARFLVKQLKTKQ